LFGKFSRRRRRQALGALCVLITGVLLFVVAPALSNADTLEQVIAATWPANEQAEAIGVAYEESGGNPTALNPSGAYCLFQLMPETAAGMGANYEALSDPYYCSKVAAQLQDAYGWGPWVAYPASGASMGMGNIEVGGTGASTASASASASASATATATASAPSQATGWPQRAGGTYRVSAGDNPSSIAAQVGVSLHYLLRVNKLGYYDYIYPGDILYY